MNINSEKYCIQFTCFNDATNIVTSFDINTFGYSSAYDFVSYVNNEIKLLGSYKYKWNNKDDVYLIGFHDIWGKVGYPRIIEVRWWKIISKLEELEKPV